MILVEKIFAIIFLLVMITVAVFVAYGSSNSTSTNSTALKITCDRLMYSDDWELGYLREVARLCSNGG